MSIESVSIIFSQLKSLLDQIKSEDYNKSQEILSGGTIGQHIRHILEFYSCMLEGVKLGEICYDNRERNPLLENDKNAAMQVMDELLSQLSLISNTDVSIQLKAKYADNDSLTNINSSISRELAYNIDHSVHHMAIIKAGILSRIDYINIPSDFGVAFSTVRHNKNVHSNLSAS